MQLRVGGRGLCVERPIGSAASGRRSCGGAAGAGAALEIASCAAAARGRWRWWWRCRGGGAAPGIVLKRLVLLDVLEPPRLRHRPQRLPVVARRPGRRPGAVQRRRRGPGLGLGGVLHEAEAEGLAGQPLSLQVHQPHPAVAREVQREVVHREGQREAFDVDRACVKLTLGHLLHRHHAEISLDLCLVLAQDQQLRLADGGRELGREAALHGPNPVEGHKHGELQEAVVRLQPPAQPAVLPQICVAEVEVDLLPEALQPRLAHLRCRRHRARTLLTGG
mmetsp:Transcript_61872/g.177464  ORF Transcript_61872/g.177464 Transcript_61872/m.177464 type:complete len:278 (+) Transcript_61872:540-1373(+)